MNEATHVPYRAWCRHCVLGDRGEREWLVVDISRELKSWGHPGGEGHKIIFKSDGEPAIVALRETLGRYHGGQVIPEQPRRGESQSNGRVEEAGRTIRGMVRVYISQLEERANVKMPNLAQAPAAAHADGGCGVGSEGKLPVEAKIGGDGGIGARCATGDRRLPTCAIIDGGQRGCKSIVCWRWGGD